MTKACAWRACQMSEGAGALERGRHGHARSRSGSAAGHGPSRRRNPGERQGTEDRERRRHPRVGAEPTRERVGDEPGCMGQGELRGEDGRPVVLGRRAAQKPAGGGLHGGIGDPEDEPGRRRGGQPTVPPHVMAATPRSTRRAGPPPGSSSSGPKPVEEARQHSAASIEPPPNRPSARATSAWGRPKALDDHDGVDDDHGAGRGDREVQGEETAQARGREVDPQASLVRS